MFILITSTTVFIVILAKQKIYNRLLNNFKALEIFKIFCLFWLTTIGNKKRKIQTNNGQFKQKQWEIMPLGNTKNFKNTNIFVSLKECNRNVNNAMEKIINWKIRIVNSKKRGKIQHL